MVKVENVLGVIELFCVSQRILYSPGPITITETNIHTEVYVRVEFDSRRSGFRNQKFLGHVVVDSK